MDLIIVESPSKAKTINKYLGRNYVVVSSYGHVRGIPSRNGAVECDNNFFIHYEVQERATKALDSIISYVERADNVYLATDPDREGEAISWHIAEILRERTAATAAKVARITFQEVTKTAVVKAIANPRSIDQNLVQAQQARQALDYLVGFSVSPILWKKLPGTSSAGRVQSVALRLICDREEEIRQFKVEEYWSITAQLAGVGVVGAAAEAVEAVAKAAGKAAAKAGAAVAEGVFSAALVEFAGAKLDKMAVKTAAAANDIVAALEGCSFMVAEIEQKASKKTPPPPFTTSTMIQHAANRLGFSAKKTAKVAQELYEGIEIEGERAGLITYMRTDSVHISHEAAREALGYIAEQFGGDYAENKPRVYSNKKNAQEAHEAIRPTKVSNVPGRIKQYLTKDQYALYDAIWRRLVASQMRPAVLNSTVVSIVATTAATGAGLAASGGGVGRFKAVGTVVAFPGYYVVLPTKGDDSEQNLPPLREGEALEKHGLVADQHHTKPPARYNEASLVKKMEDLGIGRPSTYATIMGILQDRHYVHLDKQKRFIPDIKGEGLNVLLVNFFGQYFSYDFTANLENGLDLVASGESDHLGLLRRFWQDFSPCVNSVSGMQRESIAEVIEGKLTGILFAGNDRTCPQCQSGGLHLHTTKFGWFIGCSSYPKCDYSRNIGSQLGEGGSGEPGGGVSSGGGAAGVAAAGNGEEAKKYPKPLGVDPRTGQPLILQKGPYGVYLRVGEAKDKKGRNVSLPKGIEPDAIDEQLAQELAELPKRLGKIDGEDVVVSSGRYGPYVLYNKKYYNIPAGLLAAGQRFWEISLDQAKGLIERGNKPAGGGGGGRFRKAKPAADGDTAAVPATVGGGAGGRERPKRVRMRSR